ncbi:YciI family protein [Nocardioides sp.]|uniref:YciI family protein n=1 Tax=Nocardioides sp. TaxID=35761 RepID=UPI00378308A8
MEFLCYHRDRPGSTPLRAEMVEDHWSYMDRYGAALVARGPTFLDDGTLTGSLHVVDLADPAAARAFAFDEPCYQAGAYRDVLVRRTQWQRPTGTGTAGVLALGFADPTPYAALPAPRADLLGFGPLLSDDGTRLLGAAVLAPSDAAARECLTGFPAVEVHRWEQGGRR